MSDVLVNKFDKDIISTSVDTLKSMYVYIGKDRVNIGYLVYGFDCNRRVLLCILKDRDNRSIINSQGTDVIRFEMVIDALEAVDYETGEILIKW